MVTFANFGSQSGRAIDIHVPRQSEPADILICDLLQRTEVSLVESTPVEQPVRAYVRTRGHAPFVYISRLRRTIGGNLPKADHHCAHGQHSENGWGDLPPACL